MYIARSTWLKVGISLVFWSSCFLIVFASNSRTLQKIEVFTHDSSDQIHLQFDKEFLEKPIISFGPGSLRLYLDSVRKSSRIQSIITSKINSLVKGIRVIQARSRDFVHLDIQLDSELTLDPPEIKHSGNSLILFIQKSLPNTPLLSSNKVLIEEIEQRVKKDNSLLSSFSNFPKPKFISDEVNDISPMQIDGWGETILTLVVSLIFVLFVIYLIAYLYKRFFSSRFSSMKGKVNIRQISSYYVGPKQKVIVFDFNGRLFACGVTPSSINLIAELYDENEIDRLNPENESEDYLGKKENQSRSNFLKTLEPELKKKDSAELDCDSELKNSTEFDPTLEGVFLGINAEEGRDSLKSSNNARSRVATKKSLTKSPSKTENLNVSNQIIKDFADKLSKRIKFLRPIK